ncbi:MerR family DNA-binding transcriptional regulator [Sphingomonas sp. PAMC26645]|uniref:MerR family DNA-binding transcriptional regulator n=1 Tax=Sphingomonas sp. PAMC26645 TaxID=2565555 RepID=UPI00109E1086|nr:MerR family DNA-binding transcriptional regulator [Sphingomonas sp. PAMC26645]QCB43632.1 MerR family DNA-binding transcriptional regulator [Sphingomonas sp. PAMC26645]
MNIGQAAKASGLSERMIRYFEKQGLIPAPERRDSGYRSYGNADVRRMRTIALAQDVGFPTPVIAQLVCMMDKAQRENPEAEAEAMAELDRKTEALQELRGRIRTMVGRARSRLDSDEPDMDREAPSADLGVVRPGGPTIVTVGPKRDARHSSAKAVGQLVREQDLTPAD